MASEVSERESVEYDVVPTLETPAESPALRPKLHHGQSVSSALSDVSSLNVALGKLRHLKAVAARPFVGKEAGAKAGLSRQNSQTAVAGAQLYGVLHKRVKKKNKAARWLRRFFVLREGYLLYYGEREVRSFEARQRFNAHPRGCIPLGGCIVEPSQETGHKHSILIDHQGFSSPVILAAGSERDQEAWIGRIREASKLTVRNARLGESMILELESQGLRLTKEKAVYAERLQTEVIALRDEIERNEELAKEEAKVKVKEGLEAEKHKLQETTMELKEDLVAVKAELEATNDAKAALEEEKRTLDAKTTQLQAQLDGLALEKVRVEQALDEKEHEKERLCHENLVFSKRTSHLRQELDTIAIQTRRLEQEKRDIAERLSMNEHRAADLEEEKEYYSMSAKELMASLSDLAVQKEMTEAELAEEVTARVKAEAALRSAEKALENLELALKLSGRHSAFAEQIMPDVHLLKKFFEDCAEEARLDADRPVIMKNAVYARKSFLRRSTKLRRSRRRSEAAKRLSSHVDEKTIELANAVAKINPQRKACETTTLSATKPAQPDLINFH